MKRKHLSLWIMGGIWVVLLLFDLLMRLCRPAADWYILHIFPLISGFWCRVSGLFPFSVGEWIIVAIVAFVILTILGTPLVLIFGKAKKWKIIGITAQVYGWILTWIFTIMSTRFLVLYQGTQLSQTLGEVTYTNEQVLSVVRMLVEEAGKESKLVARDENGHMILTDDLQSEARACMERLSRTYPQFAGYYPPAKPIHHAYFFSQQSLLGIYYPHSMEANYNPVVYDVNLPNTICHEYTHLKGNIFEDEAGYYAFLACMTSESHDFRYSACITALEWLDLDFSDDAAAQQEFDQIIAECEPEVFQDLYTYVPEEYWEEHKETHEVIPTDLVNDTADIIMDANLKVNGISEGKHSYHGMTALLLHHYLQ